MHSPYSCGPTIDLASPDMCGDVCDNDEESWTHLAAGHT